MSTILHSTKYIYHKKNDFKIHKYRGCVQILIMSKTIISFDIGIKNLAYCIFTLPVVSVLAWDVVNLVPAVESTAPLCNCVKASKSGGVCGKKATYTHGESNYCLTHSKNSGKLVPSKETSAPHIKKLKLDELLAFCEKHGITVPLAAKKPILVESAIRHFERCCLVPIVKPKTSNANQVHLVDIGKRIKMEFDERLKTLLPQITHVILENQISPIAGRMNTIQGMLSQYFIMRNDAIHIEFISSIGKLKGLSQVDKTPSEQSASKMPLKTQSDESASSMPSQSASSMPLKVHSDQSASSMPLKVHSDQSTSSMPSQSALSAPLKTQSDESALSAPLTITPFDKTVYKEHKSDGIFFCKQFLENNSQLMFLKQIIEASHKKDDLADSFLQGIYYMKRGNLISYNDKFQISATTA
jgi:hypothetical protein